MLYNSIINLLLNYLYYTYIVNYIINKKSLYYLYICILYILCVLFYLLILPFFPAYKHSTNWKMVIINQLHVVITVVSMCYIIVISKTYKHKTICSLSLMKTGTVA